ncbi:hypothetical protein DYB32_004150 [Aphanomyces invadans]|uniref:Cyclic nucleotide-binding domain-containing protein n=1 Tax=Aphanomyces invadans TaxID=157072 RepID=A0A418AYH8_9STRA|nr:hypothetical protein DYB32_004150 [Aphanomyces invadans]
MDETFRQLTIFRILRILRIIKLVRVFRASRIFSRWQAQLNIPMAIFKLIGHLATILLLAHWLGCLWGGVVHFESHKDGQGNKMSWMTVYGIDDKGMQTQYVTSLYWAVVTILTIGYGDIPVVTLEEKGIAIVCMIAGCGTYSFGTPMDEATTDFRQNMDHLNMLLQKERVPKQMVITFREYFLHTQDLMNHKYFSKVLDTLSPGLKGELGVYTSGEWIHRVPFFQGGPKTEHTKFITAITQHLTAMLFPPNESMIRRGDLTDRMYILSKGFVSAMLIGKGNFVGEDVILSTGVRHYEVRTLTFVDAMVLTRAGLQEVLRGHFPHKKKTIRRASIWLCLGRKMEYFLEELRYLRTSPQHAWTHAEESDWFRARMFNDHDLDLESAPLHLATQCVAAAQKALAAAVALDSSLSRRDDFFALTTCTKASHTMLEDSCRRGDSAAYPPAMLDATLPST